MKATLITRFRDVAPNGDILEMVVWHAPQSVPPCEHGFKYRLVYIVNGTRFIGYDNERGKGDHVHFLDEEKAYAFIGVDQLIEDFIIEDFIVGVERWKREH